MLRGGSLLFVMVLEAELVWESSLLRSLWWPGRILPKKLLRRFAGLLSNAGRGESLLETNPVLARCNMAGMMVMLSGEDGATKGALARYWRPGLILCMNLRGMQTEWVASPLVRGCANYLQQLAAAGGS